MNTMNEATMSDLFNIIGLHMGGYFGRNRAVALKKLARMHDANILLFWLGSASASVCLKPAKVVRV